MKNAILLHGTGATNQSNWLPWLQVKLQEQGMQVYAPNLPHADYPSLQEWTDFIHKNCPFEITNETLIVGHSAGAVAALVLTQQCKMVKQVIAVGVFKDLLYLHEKLDWHANDRFFDIPFDFAAMQAACSSFVFIHSNDDPYCPLEHAQYLTVQTNGTLKIIENSGHFNTEKSPAFKEFPALLELLS